MQRSLSGIQDGSPVRHPLPFMVDTNILKHWSLSDTLRFFTLPLNGAVVVVPYGSGSQDTVSGAWRNC